MAKDIPDKIPNEKGKNRPLLVPDLVGDSAKGDKDWDEKLKKHYKDNGDGTWSRKKK